MLERQIGILLAHATLCGILFFFFNIYLFIWLRWVLVAACRIFVAECRIFRAACGLLSEACVWDPVP